MAQQCSSLQVSQAKYLVSDVFSKLQQPEGKTSNLKGIIRKWRHLSSLLFFLLLTAHLGQTNPRSSTSRKRPWTEFRQVRVASFFVRELFGLLFFQINGCSRRTINSESLSSLSGPNCNGPSDNIRGECTVGSDWRNGNSTYQVNQKVCER